MLIEITQKIREALYQWLGDKAKADALIERNARLGIETIAWFDDVHYPDEFNKMLEYENAWLPQIDDKSGTDGKSTTTTSSTTKSGQGTRSPRVDPISTEPGLNFGVLGLKLDELNEAVRNMKVVMNNGALVGQIKSEVDRQLGMEALYKGRGM